MQAVDIGFSKYAALARDRMQLDAGVSLVAEVCGWNLELGVDLVNDSAGPSRALVVHRRNLLLAAGVFVLLEDDDFGILPAQFNDGIHLGVHLFDREGDRGDFLHELGAHQIGKRTSTRAGDEDAAVVRSNADLLLHALEKFQQLFGLFGLVPLVVLPDDFIGFSVDNDCLHRRRADIHADGIDRLEAGLHAYFARTGQNARG